MLTPDHSTDDEIAWRIAIALALALPNPPDWARWAAGWTAPCTCDPYRGDDGFGSRMYHNSKCIDPGALAERGHLALRERRYIEARATPVPAPWDVDAYLADCARRQVEPGPMPSLEWTGPDGFGWSARRVDRGIYVEFFDSAEAFAGWQSWDNVMDWYTTADWDETHSAKVPLAVSARIVTLATAAAEARGGT